MNFERNLHIDPSRDDGSGYEKPIRIEMTDEEYLNKEKFDEAQKVCQESFVVHLKERKKNEKSKSKATKKRAGKANTRAK